MVYILFVVGFVLLIKGADWLVNGSSSIAKKYGVSDMLVGLTVVSIGTSMPELIVNVVSSLNNNSDIAIGNVLGSNVANILLILGVSAVIYPLKVNKQTVINEIPFSFFVTILLFVLVNVRFFKSDINPGIGLVEGIFLLGVFAVFMFVLIRSAIKKKEDIGLEVYLVSLPKALFFVVMGIVSLFWGGKWVVDGAVHISEYYGMSKQLVGLTIVAIGTSLPELVTSAVAAYKKNTDIAVGNVVGSNIFNILWILGISSIIKPLPFADNVNLFAVGVATLILIATTLIGNKFIINRWEGIFFLICYVGYILLMIELA